MSVIEGGNCGGQRKVATYHKLSSESEKKVAKKIIHLFYMQEIVGQTQPLLLSEMNLIF